jgi:hypothetical protein
LWRGIGVDRKKPAAFQPHPSSDLSGERLRSQDSVEKRKLPNRPHHQSFLGRSHDASACIFESRGQGTTGKLSTDSRRCMGSGSGSRILPSRALPWLRGRRAAPPINFFKGAEAGGSGESLGSIPTAALPTVAKRATNSSAAPRRTRRISTAAPQNQSRQDAFFDQFVGLRQRSRATT